MRSRGLLDAPRDDLTSVIYGSRPIPRDMLHEIRHLGQISAETHIKDFYIGFLLLRQKNVMAHPAMSPAPTSVTPTPSYSLHMGNALWN